MSNLLPTISFPSPPEVTEGSYNDMIFTQNARMGVPYPIELTGVSYKDVAVPVLIGVTRFPSPFEVTGVSNLVRLQPSEPVRVRFRTLARKLGVITIHWVALINYRKEFPYPREVNGGSNPRALFRTVSRT